MKCFSSFFKLKNQNAFKEGHVRRYQQHRHLHQQQQQQRGQISLIGNHVQSFSSAAAAAVAVATATATSHPNGLDRGGRGQYEDNNGQYFEVK